MSKTPQMGRSPRPGSSYRRLCPGHRQGCKLPAGKVSVPGRAEAAGPAGGVTDGPGGDESGPGRPFSGSRGREGAGHRGSNSRPRRYKRRRAKLRPRPPGVSHHLAARAPGAPPQRLHISAGRRPVREHGGERGPQPNELRRFPWKRVRRCGITSHRATGLPACGW